MSLKHNGARKSRCSEASSAVAGTEGVRRVPAWGGRQALGCVALGHLRGKNDSTDSHILLGRFMPQHLRKARYKMQPPAARCQLVRPSRGPSGLRGREVKILTPTSHAVSGEDDT